MVQKSRKEDENWARNDGWNEKWRIQSEENKKKKEKKNTPKTEKINNRKYMKIQVLGTKRTANLGRF
jgi:hypothetical protein